MLTQKNTSDGDRSDLTRKNHIEINGLKGGMRHADEKRNRNL